MKPLDIIDYHLQEIKSNLGDNNLYPSETSYPSDTTKLSLYKSGLGCSKGG